MKTTLKIFEYKGVVGAIADMENGSFLNDVTAEGQLGMVVLTSDVLITPSALDVMKTRYARSGGSFASTMLTRHVDGTCSSIGLLGFGTLLIAESDEFIQYGRTCDLSVLEDIKVEDFDVPESFIVHVDSH